MKRKMNGLYKTAFILLLVGITSLIAAIITAYVLKKTYFSAVFSCGGSALVLLGIIFAGFSKPKRRKRHAAEQDEAEDENTVSDDFLPDTEDGE